MGSTDNRIVIGRVKADVSRFEKCDTEAEAYWLGFLFTDGCLSGTKVVFNLAVKDSKHLEKLAQFLGSPRKPKIWVKFRHDVKPPRDLGYATFSLTSCVIAANLRRQGLHERKTWTIQPWNGPSELMRHFWRGCIDGDGSIHRKNVRSRGIAHISWNIHFCGNECMVTELARYFESALGVAGRVTKQGAVASGRVGTEGPAGGAVTRLPLAAERESEGDLQCRRMAATSCLV